MPERRSQSLCADIIAGFIAQGAESTQVSIKGMKPVTLRTELWRALRGNEGVKVGTEEQRDVPGEGSNKSRMTTNLACVAVPRLRRVSSARTRGRLASRPGIVSLRHP